jgi:hypothetical protein
MSYDQPFLRIAPNSAQKRRFCGDQETSFRMEGPDNGENLPFMGGGPDDSIILHNFWICNRFFLVQVGEGKGRKGEKRGGIFWADV